MQPQGLNSFAQAKAIAAWLAVWVFCFAIAVLSVELILFGAAVFENSIDLELLRVFWFYFIVTAEMTLIPAMLTSLLVEFVFKRPFVWPYVLAGMVVGYAYFHGAPFPGIASTKQGAAIFFSLLGGVGGSIFGFLRLFAWKQSART